MVDTRSPVAETPLSQQGHSLQTGMLTVDAGLYTNIALLDRPQNAARILDNLQQLIPGIWTSSNLGWVPQRASVFNSGAPFLEFSYFVDNTGNKTPLFQAGSALYSYNLGTNTETSILTGLNASAIPTIRRSYSQLTAQSIAIYTSQQSQPQKLTSITAAQAANFNQIFPNISPAGLSIANSGATGSTQYGYTVQTVYSNGATSIIPSSSYTFTGAAALNSGLNGYAAFNGTSSYLNKANNSSLQIGGTDFTWCGWFTPTALGARRCWIGKSVDENVAGDYTIQQSASNYIDFTVYNGAGHALAENSSVFGPLVSGTEYFVICWYDSSALTLNIQVNNGTIYSQSAGGVTPTASSVELDFGIDEAGGSGDWFQGNMRAVGFFKRKLTTLEKTALYNSGTPLYYSSLSGALQSESTTTFVSYWNLSEVSGTRADSRTTANNMTDHNMSSGGNVLASNVVQWIPVPNAVGYNIYRTQSSGTPGTSGLIASNIAGTLGTNSLGNSVLTFSDMGLSASGTASMAPGTPTVTTTGASNFYYGYTVVATYSNGGQAASGQQIVNGPITLGGGAFNTITWTAATGATGYKIYRSFTNAVSGAGAQTINSTGLIGVVGPSTLTFNDAGIGADGTTPQTISPPTVNVQGTWGNTGPYFGNFNVTTNSGRVYNKPAFCEPLGTRMIYGGFPDPSTAFDIIISDANNIEQFSVHTPGLATDSVAFSYPPQLGALTGIKTMRLSNQTNQTVTIIGCTNGIAMITGSDASSYAMFTLTEEIGILSNRTWIQISNDMYFFSTVGIRNFSSLANNAILTPDEVSKNIHDQFANIDTANAYKAFAVHYPLTQEVHFWYPAIGDGGLCSHAFIMNYNAVNSSQPGTMNGVKWSTRSGTTVNCGINFNNTFYGGGNDGLLQQHYSGNNYNTTPMIFQLATSMIVMPYPIQKFSMRDFIIITEGNAQHFPLTPYVNRKMTDGSWQRFPAYPQNAVVHSANPPLTILGSWALGYGAFPGKVNKLLSMQFTGEGNFWDVEISSGSGADMLDFQALCYTMSGGGFER